ncbi:universal stress protein [Campylobacter majalis]|uniref:universal stress protein n=1 Tax=Campylobacter majalis TaxID=2790656 RepID=UPI003D68EE00
MQYKKILFPIAAGEDVVPRIYGALKVAKWFNTHMQILSAQLDPSSVYNMKMTLRGGVLYEEFLKNAKDDLEEANAKNYAEFEKICKEFDISISDKPIDGKASASFKVKEGKRSIVFEDEAKFCDLIVASVSMTGKITGSFEAAVMKSGKDCIVIPRNLTEFNPQNILVSWAATPSNSRALTSSLPILKQAKSVHCITARAALGENAEHSLNMLKEYFELHDINATYEIINTSSIPGEALLKEAKNGNFDLVVAGRQGENGLREMFLGGTSRFFLEHTDIPVFL